MNLMYVANKNVSVFDSQVLELVNNLYEKHYFEKVVLLLGVSSKLEIVKHVENLNKEIEVIYYIHYSKQLIFGNRIIKSLKLAFKNIKLNNFIIHVRNDILANYVYKALAPSNSENIKIIADIRGAGLEQLIEYSNKNKIIIAFKIYQRKQIYLNLEKIKNISVVSNELKKYVQSRIKIGNIIVNPCLATNDFHFNSENREKVRNNLGLKEDDILIVLSTGGNHNWQNTEDNINKIISLGGIKVLNLSKIKILHRNVINRFIPYKEMPSYLCAADIAIIWRERSVTNRVASPVKFSEYLCCGLPVITNDSIELVSAYVSHSGFGRVLKEMSKIDQKLLNELRELNRTTISNTSKESFGIDEISNRYIKFYKSI